MAVSPPPLQDQMGSHRWLEWCRAINVQVESLESVSWAAISDFSGSNITDLATRNHNDLQTISGGASNDYYHLTNAQHSEITTFFASTDISASEAETLTDGSNADTLHTHAGLDGDYSAEAAVILPTYTVAGVPTASSYTAGLIYVSDETGGPTIAFSDGTDWRRVQDYAIIS